MNFLESVKCLCCGDFSEEGLTAEQQKLRLAAKAFLDCDEKRAEQLARELFTEAQDTESKDVATSILFALLLWQDRFDELAQFGLPRNKDDAEQIAIYDTRNAKIVSGNEPYEAAMPESSLAQPIFTVDINGESVDLIVDTGALLMVITHSVAQRCGVTLDGASIDVDGSTGASIATQMACMDKLTVGNMIFTNKQCVVVPDAAMDFTPAGGPKMNGTIGWEVIRRSRWEIDYKNRKIRILPHNCTDAARNMCCDFYPMVQVALENNDTIVMGLDTGADKTFFGKRAIGKFTEAEESTTEYGGVGQTTKVAQRGYAVPKMQLGIGGTKVTLENVFVHADTDYHFSQIFVAPGVLGSNMAADKTLVIDYPNRHLTVV